VGIYGVIAYATQQRQREIGIRLALGARKSDVIRMVLRQGTVLVAVALGIGAAGALVLSRLLQGMVFEVSTADPMTFLAMGLVLAATALIACSLPAWRASRIPPVEAIRHER
jgi:ABC-type antimicrobial peptide transport system permease subunit